MPAGASLVPHLVGEGRSNRHRGPCSGACCCPSVPGMATWDDVARTCLALPGTGEGVSRGWRQWKVGDKSFVWERPLGKKYVAELGAAAPTGPVVAAYVPDEGAKAALIAEEPELYFTTSHFDGYPVVLCRLDRLHQDDLTELGAEAWACRAPRRLLAQYPLPPVG